ncbi:MAG: PIN domain-containing protein, partial [Pseudomonadota bacterium]|nr:PIN domain-containing protein [Pseudomonadota bacterium]
MSKPAASEKITTLKTHRKKPLKNPKIFVIDTNVLIHDPNALNNFEENQIILPITVLEELDKHKYGNSSKAFECRQAIRLIDTILDAASPEAIRAGVPITRANGEAMGTLSIILPTEEWLSGGELENDLNDNVIINCALSLKAEAPKKRVVLVSKDINMRLKARSAGLEAQDYQNDQLISDVQMLRKGYHEYDGVFWNEVSDVQTLRDDVFVDFVIDAEQVHEVLGVEELYPNEFIIDSADFVGRVIGLEDDKLRIRHIKKEVMMDTEVWGLHALDIQQAMALNLLIDPSVQIITLTGAAGSGKTILALAAAIEMVIEHKRYNKIIATRSTPALAEDHG